MILNYLKNSTARSTLIIMVPIVLSLLLFSASGCKKQDAGIDLSPFIQMAQNASCADVVNVLFLIDDNLVLSHRQGSCMDNSYNTTLYGDKIEVVHCENYDSIGGPILNIYTFSYQSMFETILANLDKADLGLGSGHTVEAISF